MQRKMVKIQLRTKLKKDLNTYNNEKIPYGLKGLRSKPTKSRTEIENCVKNKNIDIANWNNATYEIFNI